MVSCGNCGSENVVGAKFCVECGKPLARPCPSCGTPYASGQRFCAECGTPLVGSPPGELSQARAEPRPPPAAERRLVSVLFADLVGFTTLSEQRDPEDVRELLSRYFESARQVIGRYGGTVEKFIGDAVMAVWGTPAAQEDDAERAVRAALELVDLVSALGGEVGAQELRVRAGVVTGEAAVTLAAEGQGMVAGDLVNTASRVQAVADPGTVLVGEATRRASQAAIVYEDAGAHELKGKAERVRLSRAIRVIAARRGTGRTPGLEPPFVGRAAEFRLVKELFHATAGEERARLVSVVGVAGVGKSRLSWEFEKYVDGLADDVLWHRGRCLAYGEGVAYWALAEMVRMRARLTEDEEPASAQAKLREAIALHVADPEERDWVAPRLAHLLGLSGHIAPDREDLFSAWRLFFERMADRAPTVLVFEDLQWADASLLDFIEYLLEWSRNHRLFVVTLARPELADRRPTWGAGKRNFHSLFLEPLSPAAMDDVLRGLVPGLPDDVRTRIREQAEGIPLYAVETVRMLLDRGVLVGVEGEYRTTAPIETLEVPETLHALVAARLDGLPSEERRLVEDAAVLGKTFRKRAVAAVAGDDGADVERLLESLVRKEIFALEADPWSPERGQYGFVQALMQKIAYDTLSLRERKTRHLAVADHLETSWEGDEDEIVEVVAAHYLAALRAAPDAPDADEVKARARNRLSAAGERAASLAAHVEAQRYFEQAVELADDPLLCAELHERAGAAAFMRGSLEDAGSHYEAAIALVEGSDRGRRAGAASAELARVIAAQGRIDEAISRLEGSLPVLAEGGGDADLAAAARQLAALYTFTGDRTLARRHVELALELAESLRIPALISEGLNTKAFVFERRPEESRALLERALVVALDNDLSAEAVRAYNNLAVAAQARDRHEEAIEYASRGLALVRRRGDRYGEAHLLATLAEGLVFAGRWEEAVARIAEIPEDLLRQTPLVRVMRAYPLVRIETSRGDLADARSALYVPSVEELGDLQVRAAHSVARAIVRRAEGRHAEALEAGEEGIESGRESLALMYANEAFVEAVEAALALDDLERAAALLARHGRLPPVDRTPYPEAQLARLCARLASRRGEDAKVEEGFIRAATSFREIAVPFWLAVSLVEHAEWLGEKGRADEALPLLLEARELFGRLEALPWLDRIDQVEVRAARATVTPARR
ncbi:MAG: AAA family ATPase [Actinomycetota bacterium]|nr:AAA family ATPase [Actinomycetota bacterium]